MKIPLSGNTKILGTTGLVCAMGGYICGDKIDEHDKRVQEEQPYEIAKELMADAVLKQGEWLEAKEQLQATISHYRITIDSLTRITERLYSCQKQNKNLEEDKQDCDNKITKLAQERNQYIQAYQTESQEVKIRDNQIDSLENLVKQYAKEYNKLQDEYKNRSPIENEFQAIHNCVYAHNKDMYSYQYERQVKCCIKQVKKLQKEYPNDKLTSFIVNCNE